MTGMRVARTAALMVALGLGTGMTAAHVGPRLAHAAPAASTAAAEIDTFQFKPREIEVQAGTRIVWTNNDDVTHTVTSGTPEQRSDLFNGTLPGKGTKFEFTLTRTGTFTYFCARHPHMRGEIKVRE
jgi:plastocyanin